MPRTGMGLSNGKELTERFKRYGLGIKHLRDWAGEAEEIEAEAQE